MLAKFWRLHMINNTGQTMDFDAGARIAIRVMAWKISSGNLTFDTVITEDLGFIATNTIADGGIVEGTVVDNTSELQWGFNGTFEITHDVDAALGSVDLYLETSDNDGNWPSDSDDFVITDLILLQSMAIDNSAVDVSRSKNFRYE